MLNVRELATILAALLHWQEELCPHGPEIMRPYLDCLELSHIEPLSEDEITLLSQRLRGDLLRQST